MDQETDFEQERRRLTSLAWRMTGIYFVVLFLLALMVLLGDKGINLLREMRPNEVGDLLAGIAGPLAFIWLVYGYFLQGFAIRQQGRELQQNTDALKMQADQLRLLVDAENAQKELMRESQSPYFQFRIIRFKDCDFHLAIKNLGAPVSNLMVTGSNGFGNFQDRSCVSLERGQEIHVRTNLARLPKLGLVAEERYRYWIEIRYECASGFSDRRIYDYEDEPQTDFGKFKIRKYLTMQDIP